MVDWSSSYGDNSIFDSRFSLFQLGEHETKVSVQMELGYLNLG
jgi:hypothetical protein